MIINLDFEQNFYSRTATGIYKIAHDSIQLMKDGFMIDLIMKY